MINEAITRFKARKVETSSAPTSRQTKSANVKKERPPPPPNIQIKRKAKEISSEAPKATGKRKKEQEHRAATEETKSEGGKKELRASGKKSKVVRTPTVKSVKPQVTKTTILDRLLENIRNYGILVCVHKNYNHFDEEEQKKIEDLVVRYMNHYCKALIE